MGGDVAGRDGETDRDGEGRRAAQIWCENATLLAGTEWRNLKVPEREFKKLQPTESLGIWGCSGRGGCSSGGIR